MELDFCANNSGETAELDILKNRLNEFEELYQLILDNLQEGLFIIQEGKFKFVNESLSKMAGYMPEELIGKNFLDVIAPECRANMENNYNKRLTGESIPAEYETIILNKENNRIITNISVSLIKYKDKKSLIGTIKDITATKKLHEFTAIQKSIIESPQNIGIYSLDKEYKYISYNSSHRQGVKTLWGENIKVGDSILEIIPSELVEKNKNAYDRALAGESFTLTQEIGEDFVYKNGVLGTPRENLSRLRYHENVYNPIITDDGSIIGLTVFIIDITERIEGEKALRFAKEEAEANASLKSQFLANMSHEIRTPMNAIIGMTNLALKQDLSPKVRQYLNIIETSSNSLLRLINDILDFSKIDAGKLDIENIPFNLTDVTEQISDIFRSRAAQKDIELIVSIDRNVPLDLVGDPLRLSQIITNLTGNAVKFTDKGEIFINIKALDMTEDCINLKFMVKDTGIGIEKEKIDKLFESFIQADGSITRKYGGTGLGLTISRRLLELMGGDIWVESTPGEGTTFYFTITFDICKHKDEPVKVLPDNLKNLKILIADDNEAVRVMLTEMLDSFGLHADAAVDGKIALKKLDASYDLILVDWKMPEMDGIETSKKIKADKRLNKIPVILMTAFGTTKDIEELADGCVDAFIVKPIKQSELIDTIINLFDKDRVKTQMLVTKKKFITGDLINKNAVKGAYLLLAEDNVTNQLVALEILNDAGIHADVANNGKEAVEMSGQKDYDGILMDIQMPLLGGFEATKLIRHEKNFYELPIIAMTANAMKGDREKCIQSGMNDYVPKPIDPNHLFAILKRWIKPKNKYNVPQIQKENEFIDETLFGNLKGIDIQSALKRLAGNKKLLLTLLKNFVNDNSGLIMEIRENLKSNADKAYRLVHTLKGVSGNICANKIFETSKKVDQAMKLNDTAGIEEFLPELEFNINEVIASIKDNIGVKEDASQGSENIITINIQELIPLIIKLYSLVKECDTEAEDVIDSMKNYFTGTQFEHTFHKLENHISNYNFKDARDITEILAKEMNIGL